MTTREQQIAELQHIVRATAEEARPVSERLDPILIAIEPRESGLGGLRPQIRTGVLVGGNN
jgi:hypothetical protein